MILSQRLLSPLALPYGAFVDLRARAYKMGLLRQKRLDGVVISVGNLTTGGTGKTPMVLWISERLLAEGKRVGILTRGYRGRTQGAEVAANRSGADQGNSSSDEVQVLKHRLGDRVRMGVGADRFARGSELRKRGVEWFVLDDGFQHLALARDVDIVLLDATNPFGDGFLLPAGHLREPRTALGRADIIVVTRSAYAPAIEGTIRKYSAAPIFYAGTRLDSISSIDTTRPPQSPTDLPQKKVFAFCGIGNPSAFIADLRSWGYQVAGSKFFRDHHRYSQQDVRTIEAAARKIGATAVVCTEKDQCNLAGVRWQTNDVWYCRISFQISREDEFWRAIKTNAASHAAGAP